MKRIIIGMLVLVLVLSIAGCSNTPAPEEMIIPPSEPEPTQEIETIIEEIFQDELYIIRVIGNPYSERETEFSGGYMVITSEGGSKSRDVDGTTPAEYSVKGMIVSCAFQNQNDYGTLKVEIILDGEVVISDYTTADYGMVSIATN